MIENPYTHDRRIAYPPERGMLTTHSESEDTPHTKATGVLIAVAQFQCPV